MTKSTFFCLTVAQKASRLDICTTKRPSKNIYYVCYEWPCAGLHLFKAFHRLSTLSLGHWGTGARAFTWINMWRESNPLSRVRASAVEVKKEESANRSMALLRLLFFLPRPPYLTVHQALIRSWCRREGGCGGEEREEGPWPRHFRGAATRGWLTQRRRGCTEGQGRSDEAEALQPDAGASRRRTAA